MCMQVHQERPGGLWRSHPESFTFLFFSFLDDGEPVENRSRPSTRSGLLEAAAVSFRIRSLSFSVSLLLVLDVICLRERSHRFTNAPRSYGASALKPRVRTGTSGNHETQPWRLRSRKERQWALLLMRDWQAVQRLWPARVGPSGSDVARSPSATHLEMRSCGTAASAARSLRQCL